MEASQAEIARQKAISMHNENTIQLFVIQESKRCTTVINIGKDHTIHDVKLQIMTKTGIPTHQQRLSLHCMGKVLHDDCSLKDYNIQNQQALSLKIVLSTTDPVASNVEIKLVLDTWYGEQLTIYAHAADTIRMLKSKIQKDFSIPIEQQHLLLNINNEPLKDERPWWSYHIASGTKITLSSVEYQKYKAMQDSIVNNAKKVYDKLRNEMASIPKHLQNITSNAQKLIQNTSNMSTLHSLKRDTSSQISVEISTLFGSLSNRRSFENREATDAKNAINVNHENKVMECKMGEQKCNDEINQMTNEMSEIQKRIDAFQKERKRLQEAKTAKHAFHATYYKGYRDLYQSVRENNLSVIDGTIADIEATYRDCIDEHEYDAQLKSLIDEKRMFLFEKEYKTWNNYSTIAWIQSIENGYFEDKRFEGFMNKMKHFEIEGRELHEMNNRLLLRSKGLEEEKDQDILIKHIDRIVVHQNKDQNMCRVCTVNVVNTVIVPCGHAYICFGCSKTQQNRKCCICKMSVGHVVKIVMAGI
eukprot:806173_1